ncbi:ubiquitin-specific protease otu1 [Orbilia brochopaga]|uniref:Ubiquitin thioesterase OTU n=1 Tax=Orbilia brochopaga TaxID=3140254 RepID=A0AAV9UYM5_9PEZI
MRVRIRAPNGTHTLTLEDVATVGDLLNEIYAKTSIGSRVVSIRYGYPPKQLDIPAPDTLLIDLPFTIHGEQLIVSENRSPSPGLPVFIDGPSSGPLSNSQGTRFQEEEREQRGLAGSIPKAVKDFFSPSTPEPKTESPYASIKGNEPVVRVGDNTGSSCTMRVMEDDNSCMFRAVNYIFARGIDMMTELRSVVATVIQEDGRLPLELQRYSEAVLGMGRNKYCEKIMNLNTWGGYIELTILADYFNMTIHSISVSDDTVVSYNEGKENYGIVIYSGIHYDCVATSQNINDPDQDVTVFSKYETKVLDAARNLCRILKERNYATNTASFVLQCLDCGQELVGEKQAQQHGEQTGHSNFTQIR